MFLSMFLALLAPSGAFAQFGGAFIQKIPYGPGATNIDGTFGPFTGPLAGFAHVGDTVITRIKVGNNDLTGDTIRVTNIFDTIHHFSGDVTTPNLLTNRIVKISPGVVVGPGTNVFLPFQDAFVTVSFTNKVLPGDQNLPKNPLTGFPVLTDDGFTGGIDQNNASGGIPLDFILTFPGQLQIFDPCIRVTEQCRYIGNSTQALVEYYGVVTNCGNVVLTNVMVTDSHGIMNMILPLGPFGSTNFPSSRTYTNVYLATTNVSSNTVIAKGTDPLGTNSLFSTVTHTANCTVVVTPCIQVTEQCKYIGTSNLALVAYFGVVTNCGNLVLTNVMVTDSYGGMVPLGTLDFTGSGTGIPSSIAYSNVYLATTNVSPNTVIAKGSTPIGTNLIFSTVTSTANSEVAVAPCIQVTEQCKLIGTPDAPLVAYYGVVTNCGTVILTNVMVTDSHGIMNPIGILDFAGGGSGFPTSATYSNTYLATANPSLNSVVAKGTDPIGTNLIFSTVTSTANCQVTIPCNPSIQLVKVADFPCAGTNITIVGYVTNTGNLTLTDVTVFNEQPIHTMVAGPFTLAPGQSQPFTTTYPTITNTCSIDDTFSASGNYVSVCSNGMVSVVSASSYPVDCECKKTPPCISVIKEVSLIPSGCVTNIDTHSTGGSTGHSAGGNTGHSVVDGTGHSVADNTGHSLVDDTGHSVGDNGGTGHSTGGGSSHSTGTNDCACATSSRTFSKSTSGSKPIDDSLCPSFAYRITVSNCSDSVTLTNITLVDNKLDLSGYIFPTLGPLESFTLNISPVVHCSTETNVVTATGQSANDGQTATATDFAVALVQQSALVCSKIVSSVDAVITPESNEHYLVLPNDGQKHQVVFSVDVSNVGEGDLSNIKISDPLLKKYSCPVPAPFFLAAGATTNITLCVLALDCKDLPLKNKVTVSGTSDAIPAEVADPCADKSSTSHAGGGSHGDGHSGDGHSGETTPVGVTVKSTCEATVSCTPPTHSHSSGSGKTSSSSTFPHSRFTTHSGQVDGPVSSHLDPQSANIKGSWTHTRAMQGGKTGKFTSKSFDSYMVANSAGTTWNVGTLSYPGVNKVSFTGLGQYVLNKGRRTPSTVLFRVDLEDRSEPKSAKDKSASSDRLRTRIWILTSAELSQLNNPSDGLLGMRASIAASLGNTGTADGAVEADGTTPVPLGTAVFGVRAPDIDDGGSLQVGNDQIRPSAK